MESGEVMPLVWKRGGRGGVVWGLELKNLGESIWALLKT